MKKRFIFCLFLITGLFAWSLTAFASDSVQQVVNAQHDKTAAFSKLFISIIILILCIVVGKALFLFLYYKNIYGRKDAFLRILFNSRSLMTTNVRDLKQNSLLLQFKKAIAAKSGQGFSFGLDTNILMHYPNEIFELLKNDTILISREVQKELDGLKKSTDKEAASNARRAFKALEDAQTQGQSIKIMPSVDLKTLTHFGLNDSMDDRILAPYLDLYKQGKAVCFISNDRGAKITARNAGIPVLEIDESVRNAKNPWTKLTGAGVILIVLLIGIVGYNAYSFIKANNKVSESFADARENMLNKGNLDATRNSKIIDKINQNSNHIYHPSNATQFVEPTQKGQTIINTIKNQSSPTEKKKLTSQLREMIKPLVKKYYPAIQLSKQNDEAIQATFYFGQKDIRFGLLMMNWLDSGKDDDLYELLAIDSSSVGLKLFVNYENIDQVKYDIIDIWSKGPFKE